MDDLLTPDMIAELLRRREAYTDPFVPCGLLFGFISLVGAIFYVAISRNLACLEWMALLVPGNTAFAYVLGEVTVYYALPPALTFGKHIGGFMPKSCEASLPIEGLAGWPCNAERFCAWVSKVMGPDGWSHVKEAEGMWYRVPALWMGCLILLLLLPRFARWSEYWFGTDEEFLDDGAVGMGVLDTREKTSGAMCEACKTARETSKATGGRSERRDTSGPPRLFGAHTCNNAT